MLGTYLADLLEVRLGIGPRRVICESCSTPARMLFWLISSECPIARLDGSVFQNSSCDFVAGQLIALPYLYSFSLLPLLWHATCQSYTFELANICVTSGGCSCGPCSLCSQHNEYKVIDMSPDFHFRDCILWKSLQIISSPLQHEQPCFSSAEVMKGHLNNNKKKLSSLRQQGMMEATSHHLSIQPLFATSFSSRTSWFKAILQAFENFKQCCAHFWWHHCVDFNGVGYDEGKIGGSRGWGRGHGWEASEQEDAETKYESGFNVFACYCQVFESSCGS